MVRVWVTLSINIIYLSHYAIIRINGRINFMIHVHENDSLYIANCNELILYCTFTLIVSWDVPTLVVLFFK